jgi:hypothetical protein
MHALGAKVQSPLPDSVVPQFEHASDSRTQRGCTVWQTKAPRPDTRASALRGAVGRLPHGSSELEVHHLSAHYIVDDDSDHVLDA